MDILTKLATLNSTELLIMVEQAAKRQVVADHESRIINLEIYRRESLKLPPITPSWLIENLYISAPKAGSLLAHLYKQGFIEKNISSIDRRNVEITHTVLGRVRIESYLATLILGMKKIGMLILSKKDKKLVQSAINDNPATPLLQSLSENKKKLLTDLWDANKD